jgi:HK97 family phage major capsid protein
MKHLQELAAKALHDARAIMDAADKEGRGLSADELAKHDAYMADFDAAKAQIQRAERLADAESALAKAPVLAGRASQVAHESASQEDYQTAFRSFMRTGAESRIMAVGTDTAGGYFVPDSFRNVLTEYRTQFNVMRQLATTFPTSTGVMTVPVLTAYGTADWAGETGAYNSTDDTTAAITLDAYKLTRSIPVTEELLNDSAFPLESYIAKSLGESFARAEEAAFLVGNGSSKPTGVTGGSTLGVTAAATNAVTANEIVDLYHSLGRQYRQRAAWIMHDSTIKAIRKLVTGVSGDKTFIWQPGLAAGEPDMLLGRPVYAANDMAEIATSAKAILFGDFSYYYIGDRAGVSLLRDPFSAAANGQVKFHARVRTDGKLSLATAVYHLILHS